MTAAALADLDDLVMDDVYSAEYTQSMDALRHEAAFVLARIAMDRLFADGAAQYDPTARPPDTAPQRQAYFFRRRLLDYLDDRGELVRDGTSCRPTAEVVARAGMSEQDYFGAVPGSPTLRAMKNIECVAAGVLAGRDGLALLEETIGTAETWQMWQYLMVDAAPKQACNALTARVLDLRLRRGEPTVVFEGGAGLGATVRAALRIDGFRERASVITRYGFTDISRPLMQQAKSFLQAEAPELLPRMAFDRVDLDQLDDYDDIDYLGDGAADLIVFESVLHDVERLDEVLRSCHRTLKPGGWLTFTSGFRQRPAAFFACELLQSTLHSYNRAVLDPPRRTSVGYMSTQEWALSLTAAGFTEFRSFPGEADAPAWPYGGIVARRS